MKPGDTAPARRVATMKDIERPGDYALTTDADGNRGLWFLLPIADPANPYRHGKYDPNATGEVNRAEYVKHRGNGLHRISEPPWVFTELPDGTVMARESIASGRDDPEGEYWHGYLDGPTWRAV